MDVIRPLDNPYSVKGCLAVLSGNLGPKGSVLKTGAMTSSRMQFSGPAVIFGRRAGHQSTVLAKSDL